MLFVGEIFFSLVNFFFFFPQKMEFHILLHNDGRSEKWVMFSVFHPFVSVCILIL
jgi:hypothetical protein